MISLRASYTYASPEIPVRIGRAPQIPTPCAHKRRCCCSSYTIHDERATGHSLSTLGKYLVLNTKYNFSTRVRVISTASTAQTSGKAPPQQGQGCTTGEVTAYMPVSSRTVCIVPASSHGLTQPPGFAHIDLSIDSTSSIDGGKQLQPLWAENGHGWFYSGR